MKKIILSFVFSCLFVVVKSQTVVSINDVVNYVGKEVTLCDSVYTTRAMEKISLFNIGGKFPKEVITAVIFKSDQGKFKKDPVELFANKRVCITGKVTMFKDKLQIIINDPKQIKLN